MLKYTLSILLLVSVIGCMTKPPLTELDTKKPIQTIESYGDYYVYAQNDILMQEDFTKSIADLNPEWAKDVKKSNQYFVAGWSTYTLGLLSLIGCLATDPDDSGALAAWCGTSIGFSLISIPLVKTGTKYKHKAVTGYNSQFQN